MQRLIARFAYWLLRKTGWKPDTAIAVQAMTAIKRSDVIDPSFLAAEVKRRICMAIGEEVFNQGLFSDLRFTDELTEQKRIYAVTVYVKIPPEGRREFTDKRRAWLWVYPQEIDREKEADHGKV